MKSWAKSAFRQRNSDAIYLDDPTKLLTDPEFLKQEDEVQADMIRVLVKKTKSITEEAALLARFYGVKPWERKKLTKIQRAGLLWNIPAILGVEQYLDRAADSPLGMGMILDMLDPTAAEEGISHTDRAKFKTELENAKRELGLK
uniref:Uncharacterized protein n=1 Tax=viral metagenome TaxID=1070528 RepID=A0A6H1ZQQ6_9ZZZZ